MLHAFYAEVDPRASGIEGRKQVQTAAREAWAFVPTTVMPELPRLASVSYEGGHRYFVDGSAVTADIQAGGTWKPSWWADSTRAARATMRWISPTRRTPSRYGKSTAHEHLHHGP
jgi:Tfp pilus tip-associated adhesin PilY1